MRTDRPGTSPLLTALTGIVLATGLAGCDVYDIAFLIDAQLPDVGRRDGGGPRDGGTDAPAEDAAVDAPAEDAPAEDAPAEDAPGMDAPGEDTGGPEDAGTDAGPACPLRHPPERPTTGDGPDGPVVTFALRDIVFDQREGRWETMAYDLDGQCNRSSTDDFLCTPPTAPVPPFDGMMGEDNSIGERLFSVLVDFDPTFQRDMRDLMESGNSILVRIAGWNGMDDDPRVDVWIGQAVDTEGPGGTPRAAPLWDGTDVFRIADTSFVSGDPARPLIRDDNAYIAGRRLVMSMPDRQRMVIPWANGEPFALLLTDAQWTGTISADGTRLEQTWLTGRFAEMDLGPALTTVGLCPGSLERGIVDAEIREDLDVRSRVGSGGPGVTCDALSLGIEFTGYTASWGAPAPVPPPGEMMCM